MSRFAFAIAATIVAIATASPAAAQSRSPIQHAGPVVGLSPYFDRATIAPREMRFSLGQQIQARRWQRVGQCVVDRDREGSVSYVIARRGTDAADAATARLKPVFATCLAGAEIDEPINRGLRRAAVADALGVFVPAR